MKEIEKFTKEEYETIKWVIFLAEEKITELLKEYPNFMKIEKLREQKQNMTEIARKISALTIK